MRVEDGKKPSPSGISREHKHLCLQNGSPEKVTEACGAIEENEPVEARGHFLHRMLSVRW